MKNRLTYFAALLIIGLLCSCAAQKTISNEDRQIVQKILYTQARQALDSHRFRIELKDHHAVNEYKYRCKIIDGENFLSMNDSILTYRIDRNPETYGTFLRIGPNDILAELILMKEKRSGEVKYSLNCKKYTYYVITLFPNSNKCVVQSYIHDALMNGEVFPLTE